MRMRLANYRGVWIASLGVLAAGCPKEPPDVFNPTSTADDATSTASPDDDDGDDVNDESTSTGVTPTDDTTTAPAESSSSDDNNTGAFCGDGIISGNEQCDCGGAGVPCTFEGLGEKTCADTTDPLNPTHVLTGGALDCNPASCKFIVTGCVWCGDGEINGNEGCEPELSIPQTCMSLGKGGVGDLSCDEVCQIDTAACTECGGAYEFDANNCPGGWTTSPVVAQAAAPTWACGVPSMTGPNPNTVTGGVWATGLASNYANGESSALTSPVIDLGSCAPGEGVEMRVYHWFNFEGGPSNRDGGIVQVSGNGSTWTTITPVSGTGYVASPLTTSHPPVNGTPGFSGNDPMEGSWVQSNFDVSDFAGGDDLRVRFVFGSDSTQTYAGWYIDRVEFIGSGG